MIALRFVSSSPRGVRRIKQRTSTHVETHSFDEPIEQVELGVGLVIKRCTPRITAPGARRASNPGMPFATRPR